VSIPGPKTRGNLPVRRREEFAASVNLPDCIPQIVNTRQGLQAPACLHVSEYHRHAAGRDDFTKLF